MQSFQLNYHKNTTLLVFMLAVPAAIAAVTLLVLLNLSTQLSEYVFISIMATSLLLMTTVLRWLINQKIIISADISLSHEGLFFKLNKPTFIYQTKDFFATWKNVKNVSEIFCSKTGMYFYRINFIDPYFTANFSAIKNEREEAEKFFSELTYYHESYSKVAKKSRQVSPDGLSRA